MDVGGGRTFEGLICGNHVFPFNSVAENLDIHVHVCM